MKVIHLFSGGKDSTLSAFIMLSQGFDVELVSFIPRNEDSYMLQSVNVKWTKLLAKALELKHHLFYVSGKKEIEIEEMLKHIKTLNPEGLSSGALASEYQKQRVDWIGFRLNIPTFSPLWHRDISNEIKEMEVIFTRYAAYGMNQDILGKRFKRIKNIHPFLEGGEGETIVLDAPFFKYKLAIDRYHKQISAQSGELIIDKAHLVSK